MLQLNVSHYHEISEHYKHGIPLSPDYQKYLVAEENNELIYITLRDNKKLVGYYIGFITPGLHYTSCLTQVMDILYVESDKRGNSGGKLLLTMLHTELERRVAMLSLTNFKKEHEVYMKALLADCGYKPFEEIWARWFKE